MSTNFVIGYNRSDVPSEAIHVLLSFAYKIVRKDAPQGYATGVKFAVNIGRCVRQPWCCRYINGRKSFSICLRATGGGCTGAGNIQGAYYANYNELIIGLATWMFAAAMGCRPSLVTSMVHDAIRSARAQEKEIADMAYDAIRSAREQENMVFARKVLSNMEKQTVGYKLAQIEKREKAWMRKLKLAQTKLAKLRRSRSAILAAQKRKAAANVLVS